MIVTSSKIMIYFQSVIVTNFAVVTVFKDKFHIRMQKVQTQTQDKCTVNESYSYRYQWLNVPFT